MNIFKLATAVSLATVIGAGGLALGQTTPAPGPAPGPTPASRPVGAAMSIPELVERLSREGYSDVGEVERKGDKLYKVTARDAQRRLREMQVDARTGEVLASEADEEDDDD